MRSPVGAHRRLGRALNAPTTCGARGRGASRNSLRALRALRSDKRDESVYEVRCAHRPGHCAPRQAAKSPPPGCACRDALLWQRVVLTFGAPAGQLRKGTSAATAVANRHRKGAPHASLRRPEARRPRRVGARCGAPVGRRGAQGLRPRAKRVRKHSHRACLSGAPNGRAASCAMGPQARAPTGSRRVQRRPPHRSAAPGPHTPWATQQQTHTPWATQQQTNTERKTHQPTLTPSDGGKGLT